MAALLIGYEFNGPCTGLTSTIGGGGIYVDYSMIEHGGDGNATTGFTFPQPPECDFVEAKITLGNTSNNWAWLKMDAVSDNHGYDSNGSGWGYRGDGHLFCFNSGSQTHNLAAEAVGPLPTRVAQFDSKFVIVGMYRVSPTVMDFYINKVHVDRAYGMTQYYVPPSATIYGGGYNGIFVDFDYVRCYKGNPYIPSAARFRRR